MDEVTNFLAELGTRLDRGAAEYGNQSFAKPVNDTLEEILEEQIDQVGWCYVLWCQAARKTDMVRDQATLRLAFAERLAHRIRRNDRRAPHEGGFGGAASCMAELEVLAIDLFLQHQELRRRLTPIARAIEVAQVVHHDSPFRGRRGSVRDPRSDD